MSSSPPRVQPDVMIPVSYRRNRCGIPRPIDGRPLRGDRQPPVADRTIDGALRVALAGQGVTPETPGATKAPPLLARPVMIHLRDTGSMPIPHRNAALRSPRVGAGPHGSHGSRGARDTARFPARFRGLSGPLGAAGRCGSSRMTLPPHSWLALWCCCVTSLSAVGRACRSASFFSLGRDGLRLHLV